MAKRPHGGPDIRTAQPLRTFAQRLLFVAFLGTAVALMVIGRSDPETFERARMAVTDTVTPILNTIAKPVHSVNSAINYVDSLMNVHQENQRLRQEVERLQQWQSAALWLETENAQMRNLLAFERRDVERYVTGRVVGTGGTFVRSLLINVGSNDGARKGQPAVTGDGLIGRVAEVGRRSARILMITDLNSRIPVQAENSTLHAILAGDNTLLPRLIFGTTSEEFQIGMRLVTSGDGGAFPAGLPVGTVISVDENSVRVQPHSVGERPELVRLMDFGLNGILSDTQPLQ